MQRSLVVALLAVGACVSGPTLGNFAPAHAPDGVSVRLRLVTNREIPLAELLAVGDSGLLVQRSGRLEWVPLAVVSDVEATGRGTSTRFAPSYRERPPNELRLLARYPAGVTPVLLDRLLASYGQAAPD